MSDETRAPGTTTIAPEALATIARLAALRVEGVRFMSPWPVSFKRLLHRRYYSDGVMIEVNDTTVDVELHVVLERDVNIREVSRNIQREVGRAISEMVGMEAGQIDIHIEDIDYSSKVRL